MVLILITVQQHTGTQWHIVLATIKNLDVSETKRWPIQIPQLLLHGYLTRWVPKYTQKSSIAKIIEKVNQLLYPPKKLSTYVSGRKRKMVSKTNPNRVVTDSELWTKSLIFW